MSEFGPDLRYALRVLRRSPGFTVAAVLCLALGIGATTAIFSVVNAVVFRPLAYRAPEQLVRVYTEFPTFPNGGLLRFWVSGPEFLELRRDLKSFATLDAWGLGGVNLSGTDEPVRAQGAQMSGTLMETLGANPLMGRALQPADDVFGVPRTVVLSEGLWRRAFGAEANILNRELFVDGQKATVVGVMRAGFQFPPGEVEPAELWTSLQINPASPGGRGGHRYSLIGRLRPGVSLEQARQEIAQQVEVYSKLGNNNFHALDSKTHPIVVYPMHDEVVGNVRPALLAMLAAVGFVLLIACGNVANLLLARAEARQREIAIRRAMGASQPGLIRQFLIEGVLLSLLGALFGLGFAWGGLRLILAFGADSIPRSMEIGLDRTVLLFTLLVSIATGVFFGLAPLVQTLAGRIHETLKSAGGRTTASREAHRLRYVMVVAETALALVLLVGAGFMIDSFWKLRSVHPGVETDNRLTLQIALPPRVYPREGPRRLQFWEQVQQRIAALPGVEAVTLADGLAPARPIDANDTEFEGFVPQPGGPIQNVDYWNLAGHRHFETMGMRLLEGRFFDDRDGQEAPHSIIINERLRRIYYPDQNPLGKRIRPGFDGPWFTVVGVVADMKNAGLDRPAGTEIWMPFRQVPPSYLGAEYVIVKSKGDPRVLIGAVRREVMAIDSSLPISQVRTMDEVLMGAQARPRFLTVLLALFSFVALALAALGIYSVMSYAVAQRTNEFGLRVALGAQQGDVLRLVLRQGTLVGVTGAVVGAAGALALNRILKGQVYGIGEFQWLPFALVASLLMLVVFVASLVPALRATRVDPMVALRYE